MRDIWSSIIYETYRVTYKEYLTIFKSLLIPVQKYYNQQKYVRNLILISFFWQEQIHSYDSKLIMS